MKKKTPIFTYVITFLNPLVPTFLTTIFLGCLVLAKENGEKISWLDAHFNSMMLGSLLLTVLSLVYFHQIKTGRWKPVWWRNLLLILAGYLVPPLIGLIMGLEDLDSKRGATVGAVAVNLNIVYIICFIVLAKRKPKPTPKCPRFTAPLWIPAFAAIHYLSFFITAIATSMARDAGLMGSAWWWHKLNVALRVPFYSSLTKDFIVQYLPGPKAQLVFMLNGILFGVLLWGWFRLQNRTFSAENDESQNLLA